MPSSHRDDLAPRPAALLGRRPALTGLRGIAAMMVVLHHIGASIMRDTGPGVVQVHGGFLGVDIFFVLSGFLITAGLLEQFDRDGSIRLRGFYRRRTLRLGPALVAMLGLWSVYCLAVLDLSGRRVAETVAVVGTYTTNYYKLEDRDVIPGLRHMWTLAIEEQFYLLWPLALLLLLRRRARVVPLLVGALIVAVTANRAVQFPRAEHIYDVYFRTDTHVDGMLWGILLCFAWRAGWLVPRRFRALGALAFGLILCLALFPSTAHDPAVLPSGSLLTIAAVLASVLVLALLDTDWWLGGALSGRVMTWLGERSYAIYLWHVPALIVVSRELHWPPWAQAGAVLVGTLALAEISWRLVESPAQAWSRRLDRPSRAQVSA